MEDISSGNIAVAKLGAVITTADPATHPKAVWKVFQIPDGWRTRKKAIILPWETGVGLTIISPENWTGFM